MNTNRIEARLNQVAADEELRTKVVELFKQHPEINEEQIHQFAASMGLTPADVENVIYRLLSEHINRE
jgi:endonuclease V-like protein UPF0215 family